MDARRNLNEEEQEELGPGETTLDQILALGVPLTDRVVYF